MTKNGQRGFGAPTRVLVPTDFSKGAEFALRRALLLPLAGKAKVSVVHVLPAGMSPKMRARARSQAWRSLDDTISRARADRAVRPVALSADVLTGEAFVEIIRRSRAQDTELIVLGRHGRRPLRDVFIGTTADRVIRMGDVPVLVANSRPTSPYRRPLIATNLDDCAPTILNLALKVLGTEIETVHVAHAFHVPFEGFVTPTLSAREKSDYRRSFHDRASSGLESLLARYDNAGVEWTTSIRAGDARSVILSEAVKRRADLIALGTHGRTGIAHALIGSVAQWVTAAAPCDVLVARPTRFSFELP